MQWLGLESEYILVGLSQNTDPLPISGRDIIRKKINISGIDSYT